MKRETLESKIQEASEFLPGIKREDIITPEITDLSGYSQGGVDSTQDIVCLDAGGYKVVAVKENYMDWSHGTNRGISYGTRLRIIWQKVGESTLTRKVLSDIAYEALRPEEKRGSVIESHEARMRLVEEFTGLKIYGGANSLWYRYVNRKTGEETAEGGYNLDYPVYMYGTSYGYPISEPYFRAEDGRGKCLPQKD